MLQEFLKKQFHHTLFATVEYAAWILYEKVKFHSKQFTYDADGPIKVKIGLICDQITYEDFKRECAVILITPQNWKNVLSKSPPDILFCESAWSGAGENKDCWRGQIYRNHKVAFEHRRTLFSILERCKAMQIPTVFWNKEDPIFFEDWKHDFVDTALRFDYIFTTAEECIPRYRALGHREVHLLQFGFSPHLFNPVGSSKMKAQAFFAGSWYRDQPERCRDMIQLFKYVQDHDLPLTIFDRNSGVSAGKNHFPEEYKKWIKPSVPFADLSTFTKEYLYAINVNTEKKSKTMFARRVYEMMAENHVIISNLSKCMELEFPEGVYYCGEKAPKDDPLSRRRNLEHVFLHHTCRKQLETILAALHMDNFCPKIHVYVFCTNNWNSSKLQNFEHCTLTVRNIPETQIPLITESLPQDAYVAILNQRSPVSMVQWDFVLTQFSYLPSNCGIRLGDGTYEIVKDYDNWNCIFPVRVLGERLEFFLSVQEKLDL